MKIHNAPETCELTDECDTLRRKTKRADKFVKQLAEALKDALRREENLGLAAHPAVIKQYRAALAAYEASLQ